MQIPHSSVLHMLSIKNAGSPEREMKLYANYYALDNL